MDMYEFYTEQTFDAHKYLGAHVTEQGVVFRTFAPNAAGVGLLLQDKEIPMRRIYDGNFYEATAAAKVGDLYEYRIYFHGGGWQDHCDPYGFQMELRPAHKSVVCDLSAYHFQDHIWIKKRTNCLDKALNIYEMHLGSWRRKENGDWYSYTETAKALIPYHKLTFSMLYFRNENYLLPYSHDEVVHGKATILQKIHGQYEAKFSQARAMYLYMMVHPGKKLNFMGNEIGQLREWDEKRQQDWLLRKYPAHDDFYRFMQDLNEIYLSHPALYAGDYEEDGFSWVDCHQEEACVYAISRKASEEVYVAVFNFGAENQNYMLPEGNNYHLLLDSEASRYGGAGNPITPPGLQLRPFSAVLLKTESTI